MGWLIFSFITFNNFVLIQIRKNMMLKPNTKLTSDIHTHILKFFRFLDVNIMITNII